MQVPTRKIDFINDAYSQLRISGLTVIPGGEELNTALSRLEDMAYEWEPRNICTGYNFTENPHLDDPTGVHPRANQAFSTSLALRLIPDYNKAVPPRLLTQAKGSLATLSAWSASQNQRQILYSRRQPIGKGNEIYGNRYQRYYNIIGPAPVSCETNNLRIDDIQDYYEEYATYLTPLDSIDTYTIEVDPGLDLISDSLDGTRINYRIQAKSTAQTGTFQQVKIVITTAAARQDTRIINFNAIPSQTIGSI